MKKLFFSMLAVTGLFFMTENMHAQIKNDSTRSMTQDAINATSKFQKVEVSELPQSVHDSLMTNFQDSEPTEAWMMMMDPQQNKIYKIALSMDAQKQMIYTNAQGKMMEESQVMKMAGMKQGREEGMDAMPEDED